MTTPDLLFRRKKPGSKRIIYVRAPSKHLCGTQMPPQIHDYNLSTGTPPQRWMKKYYQGWSVGNVYITSRAPFPKKRGYKKGASKGSYTMSAIGKADLQDGVLNAEFKAYIRRCVREELARGKRYCWMLYIQGAWSSATTVHNLQGSMKQITVSGGFVTDANRGINFFNGSVVVPMGLDFNFMVRQTGNVPSNFATLMFVQYKIGLVGGTPTAPTITDILSVNDCSSYLLEAKKVYIRVLYRWWYNLCRPVPNLDANGAVVKCDQGYVPFVKPIVFADQTVTTGTTIPYSMGVWGVTTDKGANTAEFLLSTKLPYLC